MHCKECRLIINTKRANEAIDKAQGVAKVPGREVIETETEVERDNEVKEGEEDWGALASSGKSDSQFQELGKDLQHVVVAR